MAEPCRGGAEMYGKRMSALGVFVKDYDAAIAFYTEKLGFVVKEDVPFGPQRWVTLRLPDDDVVSVSLNLAQEPK